MVRNFDILWLSLLILILDNNMAMNGNQGTKDNAVQIKNTELLIPVTPPHDLYDLNDSNDNVYIFELPFLLPGDCDVSETRVPRKYDGW